LFYVHWFNQNEVFAHCGFWSCCVKTHPSLQLLEDLCKVNLATHMTLSSGFSVNIPELMCWFGRQVCWYRPVNGVPHPTHNIYSGWA
jgi:hypothetical protein